MPVKSGLLELLPFNSNAVQLLAGKLWQPVVGFEQHLMQELSKTKHSDTQHFRLYEHFLDTLPFLAYTPDNVYGDLTATDIFWTQLCWLQPFTAHFGSISEAAALLRGIQRNWAHYPIHCFRRAELIARKLPYISKKPKEFPYCIPCADMGVWTLLNEYTLLASAVTSSPLPLGTIRFQEDHVNPPSRAYLKLWEALTLLNFYERQYHARADTADVPQTVLPQAGCRCIDAGACPGGWTWVLANAGAEVIAIDRSPLSDSLIQRPNVRFIKHDAFTLPPQKFGVVDWVCSDVICYPSRLFRWVMQWLESGLCDKFICTLKMQGEPDFETINAFSRIPHSKIVHLTANKHELTWLSSPFL